MTEAEEQITKLDSIQEALDSIQDDLDNTQLAENIDSEQEDEDQTPYYESKRQDLERTKISKQTWSVRELIAKIKAKELNLDPNYQRNKVWKKDKQIAFIESLLMEIIVPPLYFVEVPGETVLDNTIYEVVDGKQRLSSIKDFISNSLILEEKYLEYFGDIYANKKFDDLSDEYEEEMQTFVSQTLDIYVITASSPEFTKYDIFSRLNKGSEKLRVNEIRKSVYYSPLIDSIDEFIKEKQTFNSDRYNNLFSRARQQRYDDYGQFYKAVAMYIKTNEVECIIEDYNSRPRELINTVLATFQLKGNISNGGQLRKVDDIPLKDILEKTLDLLGYYDEDGKATYYLECCIKLAVDNPDKFEQVKDIIRQDSQIKETFQKSVATTTNVNKRIRRVYEIFNHYK